MSIYKSKLINLFGIVLVSGVTSTVTALAVISINKQELVAISSSIQTSVSDVPVLECGELVYSPVQSACVDRATFDEEMQRLFTALGIDTKAYQRTNESHTE